MAGMARAALISLLPLLLAAADVSGHAGLRIRALDGGALELRNAGPSPVTIGGRLAIQRRENGRWADTSTWIHAIATCFDPKGNLKATKEADSPVTLRPGQQLSVVSWRGYSCSKQCPGSCGLNLYLGAGPFRYVATILPGRGKARSSAFTMPPRPVN